MGRRVPEPDAAEAGGLRSRPCRAIPARQGAQNSGAGGDRCGLVCYMLFFFSSLWIPGPLFYGVIWVLVI